MIKKLDKVDVQMGIASLGYLVSIFKDIEDPTQNTGTQFCNDVFELNAYCWCDDDHSEGICPINFFHKNSDFTATWYKHVNRGFECDPLVDISKETWRQIVSECIQSLLQEETTHE